MSDSDDSSIEAWSVDSYFSTDSSSSECPTPRRLLDLIADKFKLMKCGKSKDGAAAASAEQEAAHGHHDSDLPPQQLAVLLKEKLEQLNTGSEDDFNEAKRSPRKVTFQDQQSCSGSQPTKTDELMDLMVLPSTSQAVSVLPSSSKGAANGDKLQGDEDKSIFLLNFPDIDTIFDSAVKENDEEKLTQDENIDGGQCEPIEESTRGSDEASQSKMANGQIKLYDTGRITISFGNNVFEIARDASSTSQEEVIRVEVDEATQTTTMTPLGMARGYFDVLPQKAEDTEIDEECMDMDYKKTDEPDEVGE